MIAPKPYFRSIVLEKKFVKLFRGFYVYEWTGIGDVRTFHIVVIEIDRFLVVDDAHINLLTVSCDGAIVIDHIGITPFSARAAAACQQGKAKQRQRQQAEEPFHVFHIVLSRSFFSLLHPYDQLFCNQPK